VLGDTWTWDGTTWTKQAPAASPPPRYGAVMAYDAATSTAVLFGGNDGVNGGSAGLLGDTWTWDGTTWTQRALAFHPPARDEAAMAYDAATGTAVLVGGSEPGRRFITAKARSTWTWG
jgi:hypothetical protein